MKKIVFVLSIIACSLNLMAQNTPNKTKSLHINPYKPMPSAVNPSLRSVIETTNGITYKVFYYEDKLQPLNGKAKTYKGILVMGSGNNENNPTPGGLNGTAETLLCRKAAANGYIAAIVQYNVVGGMDKWNENAAKMGQDYDKCIMALSAKYRIDKSKSVVGGVSYASFMLLTDIAQSNTLSYCKGVLASCGATSLWSAQNAKIPVFNIVCSGDYETGGDANAYAGERLQNVLNPAIKAKSECITDNTCSGHCAGEWSDRLFNKLEEWLK
jgi:hypothetical protein